MPLRATVSSYLCVTDKAMLTVDGCALIVDEVALRRSSTAAHRKQWDDRKNVEIHLETEAPTAAMRQLARVPMPTTARTGTTAEPSRLSGGNPSYET